MKTINFEALSAFDFNIKYLEMQPGESPPVDQHIHSECEIYFNLSGDVSFMAGDNVYPVSRGSLNCSRLLLRQALRLPEAEPSSARPK